MMAREKRKYPRLTLKIQDGYFGNFKLPNQEPLVAPIMNISAGGINMAVPIKYVSKIKEGEHLLLKNIAGGVNLAFLNDIQAEIRWIKQLDVPGYVSVGCKLRNLVDEVRQQLLMFVDSERMSRGQYA